MDEGTATWLIAYPYLTGSMAGWSSNRKISLGILVIGGLFIIPSAQSLIGEIEAGETLLWRIWGTITAWTIYGLIFGFMANRYIRIVAVAGYFWTLGNAMIVTCVTSIFFEGVLPFFKNFEWTPLLLGKTYSYLYMLPVGLFLVLGTSIRSPGFGFKSIIRKFAEFTTILGLLELLSGQVWQTTLLNASWWLPEMKQPLGYDWFFTFALMGILILPGYLFMIEKNNPEYLGPHAAMTKGNLDKFNLKLGEPFSVHYSLPAGWIFEKEERNADTYTLMLMPASKDHTSSLQVTIFKFTEETITDRERLRRLTLLSIHSQDGRIQQEFFTKCQGVLTHEVYYQTWRYGYMLHFVIHTYEVYVVWSSRQPHTFRNTILEIQGFAETLHIHSKQSEEVSHV